MTPAPDPPHMPIIVCLGCHAPNPPQAEVCMRCGASLRLAEVNPYTPPQAEPPKSSSYRLGTLMLVIVVVAINLAAFRAGTGFGLLVFGPTMIALSRTAITASKSAQTPLQHSLTFAWSFVLVVALAASSIIAFMGTCTLVVLASSRPGEGDLSWLVPGLFLGVVAAILAPAFLLMIIRAARRRQQARQAKKL